MFVFGQYNVVFAFDNSNVIRTKATGETGNMVDNVVLDLKQAPASGTAAANSVGQSMRETILIGKEDRQLQLKVFVGSKDIGVAQVNQLMAMWGSAVKDRRSFVIGVATGVSPEPFLNALVIRLDAMDVTQRKIYIECLYMVNMDDIVKNGENVPKNHEFSAYRYFQERLFDKFEEFTPSWIAEHLIVPTVGEVSKQVKRVVNQLGGIHWQLMATDGIEGHVGQVYPGERLYDEAIQGNKDMPRDFSLIYHQNYPQYDGYQGVTFTLDDFIRMLAPNGVVSFTVFGESKADILKQFVSVGEYNPVLPISFLWHPSWSEKNAKLEVLVDQAAVSRILNQDV